MQEEELENRWKALASVGSAEGAAALEMLKELRELREYRKTQSGLAAAAADLTAKGQAKYILTNICCMMRLAASQGLLDPRELTPNPTLENKPKSLYEQGREALKAANPNAIESGPGESFFGGKLPLGPGNAVVPLASQLTDPEAAAAAATRAANGLPPVSDPAVTQANTEKPAGTHEKGTGI